MILRPAIPADHAELAEIFLITRQTAFTWMDGEGLQLGDFAVQTEGEVVHLAADNEGKILGFISVWEPDSFVHHLFVSLEHQGKGVGRALLENLRTRIPGGLTLKCMSANLPALAFYQAMGWTKAGGGMSPDGPYLLLEWRDPDAVIVLRRPATQEDIGFLWDLHVLTMQDYVGLTWGWDKQWQQENFLARFDTIGLEILESSGVPIGAIAVKEEPDHFFLREIEILPAWQRRGIGKGLVKGVVSGAREKRLPVRLQVLKVNPARRFYERTGFQLSGETETHFLMEHPADG